MVRRRIAAPSGGQPYRLAAPIRDHDTDPCPRRVPTAWGLLRSHVDARGERHALSAETVEALLGALDADRRRPGPGDGWPLVAVQGDSPALDGDGGPEADGSLDRAIPGRPGAGGATEFEIELEDGGGRACGVRLPPDLPLGYHRLHGRGHDRLLVVTPPRCHLPSAPGFGFAVQLYGVRSAASWGIGDLADLTELGRWAAGLGAAMLLVNPLHASLSIPPIEPSPYFPTSRLFLDPLYVRPELLPGGGATEDLAVAARQLNGDRRIDRDRVASLKAAALERCFRELGGPARWTPRSAGAPGSAISASSARWRRGTGRTGGIGRAHWRGATRRRSAPRRPSWRSGCGSTPGCSCNWTVSSTRPAPPSPWSAIWPSASTREGPTPGSGRS